MKKLGAWIFQPPYSGAPWLAFLYIAISFVSFRQGGVFVGHLTGFDDHVRMTQILNWVNGAGWYDRTIMRVNAPEGFTTIWSRFVDLPTALIIIVAQNFMAQKTAVLVASVIVPFAELAILFPVMRYFVRPLVGKRDSWLAVLFLIFTSIVSYRAYFSVSGFHPGQASHHPWYVILNLVLFGSTARLIMGVTHRRTQHIMALSIGLLLAVGIESFPMIAMAAAFMVLISFLYDRPAIAMRGSLGFAYGALLGLLLLPTHQPPKNWLLISFAEPSILGPILVIAAALYLALAATVIKTDRVSKSLRFVAITILAALFAALLVAAFPQILDGPAAALSPAERDMAIHMHTEAMSVHSLGRSAVEPFGFLMPIVIALVAGLIAIVTARGPRRRAIAIIYFGFAAICGGLSEIYSRFYHHAMTTTCAWLVWVWQKLVPRPAKRLDARIVSLFIFILLGPFWLVMLPQMDNDSGASSLAYVLFFPAEGQEPAPCDTVLLNKYLEAHFSKDTMIIVPEWDSSRFLYYTDFKINFLANYPSQDKVFDNMRFFQTPDSAMAASIALRHNIDLVAICSNMIVWNPPPPGMAPGLEDRLVAGEQFPWLIPVPDGSIDGYLLYKVDKAALIKGLK